MRSTARTRNMTSKATTAVSAPGCGCWQHWRPKQEAGRINRPAFLTVRGRLVVFLGVGNAEQPVTRRLDIFGVETALLGQVRAHRLARRAFAREIRISHAVGEAGCLDRVKDQAGGAGRLAVAV